MQKDEKLFIRESSGLIKHFGIKDAAGKVLTLVLPLAAYYTLLYSPGVPGADNFGLSALIGFLFAIPPFYIYLRLSELIPRSSGEYIYISRFLHPLIGTIQGITNIITVPLLASFTTIELTVIAGLVPSLQLIGFATKNYSLVYLGYSILTNPTYLFITSAVFTILFGVIISLHNKYMSWVVVVSMVLGQIIGPIIASAIFLIGGNTLFTSSYNNLLSIFSQSGSYQSLYNQGASLVAPFDVFTTIVFAILIWIWEYSWFFGPSYFAGEYKGGRKTIRYGMIIGWLLADFFVALLSAAAEYAIGLNFFNYASLNGWGNIPISFSEGFVVWAGIMVLNNPVLLWALAITGFLAELAISIVLLSLSARVVLAMSFDRLLPEKLSTVTKSGSPILGSLLVTGISLFWVYMQTLGGFAITSIGILSILMIYQMLPAIASAILLGKRKILGDMISNEDSKKLVIIGIIAAVDLLFSVGLALGYSVMNSTYASIVFAGNALDTNILIIILPILGTAYYLGIKKYREKINGLDIEKLFKVLPPE
ncbi:MAG: amino acid permease [Sulfolobus sp.]